VRLLDVVYRPAVTPEDLLDGFKTYGLM
jgi:hypothetical protein